MAEFVNTGYDADGTPRLNTIWKHRNGNLYQVVFITNRPDEPRYPKTVVYRLHTQGMPSYWSRPVSDWARSMEYSYGGY